MKVQPEGREGSADQQWRSEMEVVREAQPCLHRHAGEGSAGIQYFHMTRALSPKVRPEKYPPRFAGEGREAGQQLQLLSAPAPAQCWGVGKPPGPSPTGWSKEQFEVRRAR